MGIGGEIPLFLSGVCGFGPKTDAVCLEADRKGKNRMGEIEPRDENSTAD